MENIVDKLEYAKKAVIAIINSPNTLVDMHGLEYWAMRVEKLRGEIRQL